MASAGGMDPKNQHKFSSSVMPSAVNPSPQVESNAEQLIESIRSIAMGGKVRNSAESPNEVGSPGGASLHAPSPSSEYTTYKRPAFVQPKMQSHGKLGSVSEEYLRDRKARLDRLKKQMAQKSRPKPPDDGEEPTVTILTDDIGEAAIKKPLRNVFTRMEEPCMQEGPLSILYRSVKARQRVRVWTRSYKHVRGICTGIVIAFDKHFNMAMVDVDEVYRPPKRKVPTKRKKRKKKKKKTDEPKDVSDKPAANKGSSSSATSEGEDDDVEPLSLKLQKLKQQLATLDPEEPDKDTHTSRRDGESSTRRSSRNSSRSSSRPSDQSSEKPKPDRVSDLRDRLDRQRSHSKSNSSSRDSRRTRGERGRDSSSDRDRDASRTSPERRRSTRLTQREAPARHRRESPRSNRDSAERDRTEPRRDNSKSHRDSTERDNKRRTESPKRRSRFDVQENVSDTKRGLATRQGNASMPSDTSRGPPEQSELRERHVNQLFIRGDNVVMVAFA